MSTAIEWTDETWNPVTGCTKVSPGCKFCYAERVAHRYWGARKFTDVRFHADRLDQPLRWRRPRRVFVNSMSDLFHEAVPDEDIDRIFAVMALAPAHTFQVLTKRPERMQVYVTGLRERSAKRFFTPALLGHAAALARNAGNEQLRDVFNKAANEHGGEDTWPLPNVHLGVSVEDQPRADERIPLLLETPAAVRFLSVEPLLGPVDLRHHLRVLDPPFVSWVIVGGESGGSPERALVGRSIRTELRERGRGEISRVTEWQSKPEALAWVRALRDHCVAAGVPFFFKQWGGPTPKAGGRLLDGREWSEYPAP